jgi:hypothetical protein
MFVRKEEQRCSSAAYTDHYAGRQFICIGTVSDLSRFADAVPLKREIDFGCGHFVYSIGHLPERDELIESGPVALSARPVTRCERRRFVEEEQFGKIPRGHELPWIIHRGRHAVEPINFAGMADDSIAVVERAAITYERERRRLLTD